VTTTADPTPASDDHGTPLLGLKGLTYVYEGGQQALRGVDLKIRARRRIAMVGANGAGKTTLLLHLNGTLKPASGALLVGGSPARYDRRGLTTLREMVAMVFQNPDDQLFAGVVYQDVSFGPLNLGLREDDVRARVKEALEALEITHLRDRPTHMLSFGQKKRVAIAGAVAMRPRILVLDEPMAGLDPSGAWSLKSLLERLHAAGTTLLVATHDMSLAYEWAEEVAVLRDGVIVAHGEPWDVMADPAQLAHCGLRTPWVAEIGGMLREYGVLAAERPLPRTRDELKAAIVAAFEKRRGQDERP